MRTLATFITLSVACVLLFGGVVVSARKPSTSVQAFPNFDPSTGLEFLDFAYAAYCSESLLNTWSCKWCNPGFTITAIPTSTDGGFSFVGFDKSNQSIVVSFRGSTNLQDWIVDLMSIEKVPYKSVPNAEVGKGFNDMYNELQPAIFSAVKSILASYPHFSVYVTGHSLGAALSVLCAVDLVQQNVVKNVTVYNYGCPRVGNQVFANYYNQYVPVTYRVVNGHDIVPHLPLEDMGFYHVPMEVWENPAEGNTYQKCSPTNGEDPSCSDSNETDLSVYDHLHYMNQYETCATTLDPSLTDDFVSRTFSLSQLEAMAKVQQQQ